MAIKNIFLLSLILFSCSSPRQGPNVPQGKFIVTYGRNFHQTELDKFGARVAFVDPDENNERILWQYAYINAGATEIWRPYKLPAAAIGRDYQGWDGEKWLDIRNPAVLKAVKARMKELKKENFQYLDLDNLDSHEQDTGFAISRADQVKYVRSLIAAGQGMGFAVCVRNCADFIHEIQPDAVLCEEGVADGFLGKYKGFLGPVFDIEYRQDRAKDQAAANKYGIYIISASRDLSKIYYSLRPELKTN